MSNIFDRIKWKSSAAGFVLTVGATVNMDATAFTRQLQQFLSPMLLVFVLV